MRTRARSSRAICSKLLASSSWLPVPSREFLAFWLFGFLAFWLFGFWLFVLGLSRSAVAFSLFALRCWLLILGPREAPARVRRKSPQGGRDGSRPVRCQYTDVLSANPAVPSRTCGKLLLPQAGTWGCISFGYFSLCKQRKVTRSTQSSGSFALRNKTKPSARDAVE